MNHLFELSSELCIVDILQAARGHVSIFEQLVMDILQLVHLLRVVRDGKAVDHEVMVIGVVSIADEHLHDQSQFKRIANFVAVDHEEVVLGIVSVTDERLHDQS